MTVLFQCHLLELSCLKRFQVAIISLREAKTTTMTTTDRASVTQLSKQWRRKANRQPTRTTCR